MSHYVNVSRYKNFIIHQWYDDNGRKRIAKYDKDLPLYIGRPCEEKTGLTGIFDENLEAIQIPTIRDYYNITKSEDLDFKPHGVIDPVYQFIAHHYPSKIKFDVRNIRIFYYDIEVMSEEGFPHPDEAKWPITSISIKDSKTEKFYVISTKSFDKYKTITKLDPNNIHFTQAKSETQIYEWMFQLFKKFQPDCLCGFYSSGFDDPYIINRAYHVSGGDEDFVKQLSPYGEVISSYKVNEDNGKKEYYCKIGGIHLLDYQKMYKKFVFKPREMYTLDFISEEELGDNKLHFDDYDSLADLWRNNSQLYIDYNIYDVELISKLDKKLKLFNILFSLAYKAKANFPDALGTTRIWDVFIYNILRDQAKMPPPFEQRQKEEFAGGFVREPIKDIYKYIMSFDLNSLYPHLHQQYNISPECLIEDKREKVSQLELDERFLTKEIKGDKKLILSANGTYYRKDKVGFIPTILRKIYDERKDVKKQMLIKEQELEDLKNEIKRMEGK